MMVLGVAPFDILTKLLFIDWLRLANSYATIAATEISFGADHCHQFPGIRNGFPMLVPTPFRPLFETQAIYHRIQMDAMVFNIKFPKKTGPF
jgi:hypothetical protein